MLKLPEQSIKLVLNKLEDAAELLYPQSKLVQKLEYLNGATWEHG